MITNFEKILEIYQWGRGKSTSKPTITLLFPEDLVLKLEPQLNGHEKLSYLEKIDFFQLDGDNDDLFSFTLESIVEKAIAEQIELGNNSLQSIYKKNLELAGSARVAYDDFTLAYQRHAVDDEIQEIFSELEEFINESIIAYGLRVSFMEDMGATVASDSQGVEMIKDAVEAMTRQLGSEFTEEIIMDLENYDSEDIKSQLIKKLKEIV